MLPVAQSSQTSRTRQSPTQKSLIGKAKKLCVIKANTPWIPPGLITRLGTSRIGPTTNDPNLSPMTSHILVSF